MLTPKQDQARPSRAPKFRDDIDLENTWVVSDSHFGHDNIVGFCHRPEEHQEIMLAEWRKAIPDDATVLHLGDLCYKSNGRFKNIIAKELTGERKLLIQGNHDRQRFSFYRAAGFQLVRPFSIWFVGDYRISFSHYPWNTKEEGYMDSWTWRIHGHIHNNGYTREQFVPFLKNHINLSVEQTKYRPVNLKHLLDGAILGRYEETTEASLEEARTRRLDHARV